MKPGPYRRSVGKGHLAEARDMARTSVFRMLNYIEHVVKGIPATPSGRKEMQGSLKRRESVIFPHRRHAQDAHLFVPVGRAV